MIADLLVGPFMQDHANHAPEIPRLSASPNIRQWTRDRQSQCIPELLNSDRNVVVSAPTGSGKTILFELAMIRSVRTNGSNQLMFYTAPTKALCREKFQEWSRKLSRDPLGISCIEYTGDSDTLGIIPNCPVLLITTPEKLDAWTRFPASINTIKERLCLALIDEVHTIGEDRGCVLEGLICRLKALDMAQLRTVAVSATISNINDFSAWLQRGGTSAASFEFGSSTRPIPLVKHVLGYPYKSGQNAFLFENSLNNQLPWIIKKYAGGLPTLIFCSTRKSVEMTAISLSKGWKTTNGNGTIFEDGFTDKRLGNLVPVGIAFHHAGVPFEDRRAIENLYSESKIKVLCTTSTLAVGVNLPAHLVIIKGTKHYSSNGYEEYSKMDINQMLGRAGRPQFDTFGVGVIMTDEASKVLYENKTDTMDIESSLLPRLSEVLLAECSVGTIRSYDDARRWFRATFLFQRITQKPSIYKVGGSTDALLDGILEKLLRCDLFQEQNGRLLVNSIANVAIKHYIGLEAIEHLVGLPEGSNHQTVLEVMCKALGPEECKFTSGDKSFLNSISRHNCIQFPLNDSRVKYPWQKAFLLTQLLLSRDETVRWTSSTSQDARRIITKLQRICSCVVEMLYIRKDPIAVRNAIELIGAIHGGSWHHGHGPLMQIDGIGPAYAKKIFSSGTQTVAELKDLSCGHVELLLKKNPPFGSVIKAAAGKIPFFALSTKLDSTRILKLVLTGNNCAEDIIFLVICGRDEGGRIQCIELKKYPKREVLAESMLVETLGYNQVTISLMSLKFAGINVHKILDIETPITSASGRARPEKTPTFDLPSDLLTGEIVAARPLEQVELNDSIASQDELGRSDDPGSGLMNNRPHKAPTDECHIKKHKCAKMKDESPEGSNNRLDAATIKLPPTPESCVSAPGGPKRMRRGSAAPCRHTCRNKLTCKHSCCKETLDPFDRRIHDNKANGSRSSSNHLSRDPIDRSRQEKVLNWIDTFRATKEKAIKAGYPLTLEMSSGPDPEMVIPVTQGIKVKDALKILRKVELRE